ncbi:MAG: hypothetical protein K8J31_11965 [Anaerolineae bacterium]|nr:hypothetical protein [Anaerolineae bacterium]
MASQIRIISGDIRLEAALMDTPTAQALWAVLPLDARANRWGDEIYFSIPVAVDEEADARSEMAVGEIAYWPPGTAFCIFFGPTPASSGSVPAAASPVNVLGKIEGDATRFRAVKTGSPVRLERA